MSVTMEAPADDLISRLGNVDCNDPHSYDLADSTEQSGRLFARFTEEDVVASVIKDDVLVTIADLRREACDAARTHDQQRIGELYHQITEIALIHSEQLSEA